MSTSPAPTGPDTAASPLFTRPLPWQEYTDLAVDLAKGAEAATVRILLTITCQPAADRIAAILDERTDLPPDALALLVAARPTLRAATTRLKNHLFPDTHGCHRFTRAVAALAHHPDGLDAAFLAGERFAAAAAAADPAAVLGILRQALAAPRLDPRREHAVRALSAARRHRADALDRAASTQCAPSARPAATAPTP
ncbi:hypothetical protein [Streptosporangium canum]|uniref:hypothetical protein n=1 Tax=Streptosporangium canum TaxID=324952 RepID=UPI0037B2B4DE